jgi:hypothetical protein
VSSESLRPRLFSFAAGLVIAFLIAVLTSVASQGLAIGVADNNAFMTPDLRGPQTAADLGLDSIRLFVWWKPGQTKLTALQKHELGWAVSRRRRTFVSVTGQPLPGKPEWIRPRGVSTASGRRAYVSFLGDVVRQFPAVKDVSVWNEPNLPLFWSDRKNAPRNYAALLAASYDTLHPLGVRVYGFELHPWREPGRWLNGVGAWMRATHRKRPVFDYIATHPYPLGRNEAPWARHRQSWAYSMGDVQRLRRTLRKAFARTAQRRLHIFYTETGWTTAPFDPRWVTPSAQATRMVQALELAYCQRGVHAFMNFLVADAPDAWQTGFLTTDWLTRKPVYAAYKAAVKRARAKKVNCSKFPKAVR